RHPAILNNNQTKPRKGIARVLPPILNAQGLSKRFGAVPLFEGISFVISERDRIGLIGPNGSGKSTLLRVLSGIMSPDSGEVALRKRTRLSYVEQESQFAGSLSVRQIIESTLKQTGVPELEWEARTGETLGRTGFEDFEQEAAALSGGWRKRLAIAQALVQQPDILLLDEPTNHLDLAGIEWLEELLQRASFASVIVSHDRYFLENVATEMVELSRVYPEGFLRTSGSYTMFLEKKEEFLHAQSKRQEALENLVKNEIAWLRRGAKARTRKSKARIGKAHELMGELADLNNRTRSGNAAIDFSATERQTKRLIELENISYSISERTLFSELNFAITAGMRVGLVGPNGSGKSTLLRLLQGELAPTSGAVRCADALQIVYFDQNRELDSGNTLRRALAPESDSVIYQDRVIHVASWAARFLFTGEQLNQPVANLSGGERARVLIARLMLQPADVLLLDEPTNDLDIPTLEILEESLLEYRGALVLVTHDRYMLDRISTVVVGLDGLGHAGRFADYSQWELWQAEQIENSKRAAFGTGIAKDLPAAPAQKRKLSYLEAREYANLEQRVAEAEVTLAAKREAMEDPTIASDADRIIAAHAEFDVAQKVVDELYARWSELESKIG
ncbi:MAG: ABC-F family ATP-binding cassette domain-containing protein, partial [Candidatus Korobacteraceae bacterium]